VRSGEESDEQENEGGSANRFDHCDFLLADGWTQAMPLRVRLEEIGSGNREVVAKSACDELNAVGQFILTKSAGNGDRRESTEAGDTVGRDAFFLLRRPLSLRY
jgi:hypothetical protein